MMDLNLKNVTILGSTGSIGLSTLDVIRRNDKAFQVFALTANKNVNGLFEQCQEFKPQYAVLRDHASAKALADKLSADASETIVLAGGEGLCEVASHEDTEIVMAAIVGAAGLEASLAAANSGKRLLLANKESLVMSGALFMQAVKDQGATLLPIDSEHNAIFQCLANGAIDQTSGLSRILLVGSGGPLLRTPIPELAEVKPDQACAHPNFSMGRKISVDSASMMNKGLELIEATWLFNVPVSKIDIILHPQQIIHSMVEYDDGSILAQMGHPDMRTPIAHGMAWPERIPSGVSSLDLLTMGKLDFEPLDRQRFPCVALAEMAANGPDSYPIALNAANEVAVDAFLHELIRFIDIPIIVEKVLSQTERIATPSIASIGELDVEARRKAEEQVQICQRQFVGKS